MNDTIIYQQDRLTVCATKLIVGDSTVFYSSVSGVTIYEGRPLLGATTASLISLIPFCFIVLMGTRLLGSLFPLKAVAILVLLPLAIAAFGLWYRVKCLFVDIDGHSVPVLKGKDRFELELAQRAIEDAKRAYEAKGA